MLTPTPIQARSIPAILKESRDVLGLAATGTGKTASFGLPLIQTTSAEKPWVQALVLAPTRELAQQIAAELKRLSGPRSVQVLTVYGGAPIGQQINKLRQRPAVVVGTPGRVIDLLKRKALCLSKVGTVVLDEADDMLNMGFIEDIETILSFCPDSKRMMLFSATLPQRLRQVVTAHMSDYVEIKVAAQQQKILTEQFYHRVYARDKFEALKRLIDYSPDFYGIIFCRTKADVDEVAGRLVAMGYAADALHGDISQHQREKLVAKFRKKLLRIMVATDVASRGVDFAGLTHVINFQLPERVETYIHRIGRTGRAGMTGFAHSLVSPGEMGLLALIKRIAKQNITEAPLPDRQQIEQAQAQALLEQTLSSCQDMAESVDARCQELAQQVLARVEPELALAGLFQQVYGRYFAAGRYRDIETPELRRSGRPERRGGRGRRREVAPPRQRRRGPRRGG